MIVSDIVRNNSRKLSLLFFANVCKMLQEIVFQKIESMSPLTMYYAWPSKPTITTR